MFYLNFTFLLSICVEDVEMYSTFFFFFLINGKVIGLLFQLLTNIFVLLRTEKLHSVYRLCS